MAEEVSYYAIVNDFSSHEEPGGVLRRIKRDGGERDGEWIRELAYGALADSEFAKHLTPRGIAKGVKDGVQSRCL